jgi:hypothetical protein
VGMEGAYRTGRIYSSPPARDRLEKQCELAALLNTVRWETVGMEGAYRTGHIYSSPPARDQSWRNSASLPQSSTLSGGKQREWKGRIEQVVFIPFLRQGIWLEKQRELAALLNTVR